jgi:hypothetical protein
MFMSLSPHIHFETFEKRPLLPNLPPSPKASAVAEGYGGTGWRDKRRQAQILILEILQGIPVFRILAFLDFEQN